MKRKGVIFTMDAIMAIIIVFMVIVAVRSQMQGVDMAYWDNLYAQKLADDVIASLDYKGVLDTLDEASIQGNLSGILPPNYDMWLQIKSYTYGDGFNLNETIDIGSDPEEEDSVISGRSVFVSGDDEIERYNLLKFKIWSR